MLDASCEASSQIEVISACSYMIRKRAVTYSEAAYKHSTLRGTSEELIKDNLILMRQSEDQLLMLRKVDS